MELNPIVTLSSSFVTSLFEDSPNSQLSFHNAYHTGNVVSAAQEIGLQSEISAEELALVSIAAWFHDAGYLNGYLGHELSSITIAENFLAENGLAAKRIERVASCILATTFPQRPKNTMEMVLCDADFYHFSRPDYTAFEKLLRKEWETCLKLCYTDEQWNALNLEMLTTHEYFTQYGKTVLQQRKQENMNKLKLMTANNDQRL